MVVAASGTIVVVVADPIGDDASFAIVVVCAQDAIRITNDRGHGADDGGIGQHDASVLLGSRAHQSPVRRDHDGASVGYKSVKPGAKLQAGYLSGRNGLYITFGDADVSLSGRSGGGNKKQAPKLECGGGYVYAKVRRQSGLIIDLSKPYVATKQVVGSLVGAQHFCFDSSLLEPAGRQLLRLVCADQLAALDSEHSTIVIIGHTDRPGTDDYNLKLSQLRAKNVKLALRDILGSALRVPDDRILTIGFGEWLAKFKLRNEQVRRPEDRRVDVLVNGSIVASFHD